ncbi:hypothetical protein CLOM_g7915 [Closterium sp. NIES-68]|nr:hypothetical protein CLOM_g7915 [Closterium sp. NIES-68]
MTRAATIATIIATTIATIIATTIATTIVTTIVTTIATTIVTTFADRCVKVLRLTSSPPSLSVRDHFLVAGCWLLGFVPLPADASAVASQRRSK